MKSHFRCFAVSVVVTIVSLRCADSCLAKVDANEELPVLRDGQELPTLLVDEFNWLIESHRFEQAHKLATRALRAYPNNACAYLMEKKSEFVLRYSKGESLSPEEGTKCVAP